MKRTYQENKSLYESIMRDVAVIVKRHLNELSIPTVKRAQNKRNLYDQEEDDIYFDQDKFFKFIPQDKLTMFDCFEISIDIGNPGDNIQITITNCSVRNNNGLTMLGEIELGNDVIVNQSIEVTSHKPVLDNFFEDEIQTNKHCFKFFSRRDAVALSRLIKEETGIELSFRNFTTNTIEVPVFLANPDKFDPRNYTEDEFVEFKNIQR